ncbi:hypothetical protein LTR56_003734 [Elasticomyces elasticus]|nr:hypothetical protein LTR22_014628 [Elasticomyces elasticus]KAK3654876.1 hypothetical protein LTR56_003734 [Elasticomyces elasticus]KAK4928795.1 hypothetical protein LTR49_004604 [Elasticomyces elasticus]KAK5766579.1 hypothetical protein LTS12_003198 [Elasticomyces elasticus]
MVPKGEQTPAAVHLERVDTGMTTDSNSSVEAPPSRPRTDDGENVQKVEGEEDAAFEVDEVDELAESKPKKKRKIIKNSDKKYLCPNSECGKSYSRAEHLYRHQLNHTPKQIYRCDFPGCERHFVRADLCARHKERHTAKGSHLQRKDAFMHSQRGPMFVSGTTSPRSGDATLDGSPVQLNHAIQPAPYADEPTTTAGQVFSMTGPPPPANIRTEPMPTSSGMHLDPQLSTGGPYSNFPSNANGGLHISPMIPPTSPTNARRFSYDGVFARPASVTPSYSGYQNMNTTSMQPPPLSSPSSTAPLLTQQIYPSPLPPSQQLRSPTSFSNLPSLPPFGFPQSYTTGSTRSGSMMSPPTYASSDQQPMPNSRTNSMADFNVIDQMMTGYAMPVFGADGLSRSPPPVFDDTFLNSLFGSNGLDMLQPSPPGPEPLHNPQLFNIPLPALEPDGTPRETSLPVETSNNATSANVLDINMRESTISETKKARLARLVQSWPEVVDNPGRRSKGDILMGDSSDPHHVLSLHMLKTYITSFWVHIHQQMPLLHRPTFSPETCPDLLLLAMMCLGGTCLERTHSDEVTVNSSELAVFIAYHVRWEVFKDAEFRPPAKLWTFQTLLLLELFEKMFTTKSLHERAHIHHATTLTVMRRGSSLIGRSATEAPESDNDPTRTPPGPDGSINTSGQNTPDAFWNRWITSEATRRVAFAAFIIDSTHATLFGHSAVMSPHDLRLPLPCDEALWSATSSAEVQRVEASLAANGFKPTSFLDALKRTLNGQKVRTNTFGRVVLMAGLLNVSWHMNQRDLQVSSLGAFTPSDKVKWRSPLTRAFDFWRRDFDDSLSKNEHWLQVCNPNATDRTSTDHRDNVFESRTCLHSLAHMAMHVDIVDCLVFAGSDRVLGRIVTDADRAVVQRRMREQWAPSARARDATFYALRFLCEVLIPEEALSTKRMNPHQAPTFTYSARDDCLLNRPWVLYFALLIVWSYGYALDGPIRPSNYTLTTRELQIYDMQRYLIRMGGVASPDDLNALKDRNSCLGLLLLLRGSFKQPRWELLHEAHEVLGSCVDLLLPGHSELAGGAKSGHLQGV